MPDVGVVYERKGVDEVGEYACLRVLSRQATVESGSVIEGGHWTGRTGPRVNYGATDESVCPMYIMVFCGVCKTQRPC